MNDVMVDIESMSVHQSLALILSVAVVPFVVDRSDGPFIDRENARRWVLDPLHQIYLCRRVDQKTQRWWADPTMQKASEDWRTGEKTNLISWGGEFCDYFQKRRDPNGNINVWANGICFDLVNLETLLTELGFEAPWPYNAARDARTIYKVCDKWRDATRPDDVDAYHTPMADCEEQIYRLWEHWPVDKVVARAA